MEETVTKIALLASLLAVTGCAEYRAMIGANGAEAADAALHDAEWIVCKASTSGALERRYHLHSDVDGPKATAWRGLCYQKSD